MGGMAFPDCDLRKHPPRGARVMLGGLYFLARTIDKTRAKLAGTLGEYKVTPGISGYLFEELGITEEQFDEVVRNAKSDEDVVAWLHANTDQSKYPAINEMLCNRRIRDEQHLAEVLPRYPILRERPELRNWFEIFDLDDEWMFRPENIGKPGAAKEVPV
jgi:hypothetical protein